MNMKMLLTVGMTGCLLVAIGVAQTPSAADLYQEARHVQEIKGDVVKAIELYRTIVDRYGADQAIAPKALLELADCYEKLGKSEAVDVYQRIVREYAASGAVAATAQTKLTALAQKGSGPLARQVQSFDGNISPDGRYAAFQNMNGDLAIRDVASGRERVLTNCGTSNECKIYGIVPSPDSRFIAYEWNTRDKQSEQWTTTLRVIGRDGGQPRVVYPNEEKAVGVVPKGWSPDGKSILALMRKHSTDRVRDLVLIPASGGAARLVKHFESLDVNVVRMSPDGRSVAYAMPAASGKPERDLVSLSLDSGREVPMLTHPADDYVLDWFAEGDPRILFGSDRGGTYGIWAARVVDGRTQGEPVLIRPDTGPVWSLGFTGKGDFYYGMNESLREVSIATLDPATGKQTGRLARFEGRFTDGIVAAAWSPDGNRMLYAQGEPAGTAALSNPRGATGPAGHAKPVIQTISTGEVRTLPGLEMLGTGRLAWMPDGRSVIVNGTDSEGEWGLFQVNIETGAFTNMRAAGQYPASSHPNPRAPAVSPDGRRVFFNPGPGGSGVSRGIVVRDLTSGAEQTVTTRAVGGFALSPDGRWLAAIGSSIDGPRHVFVIPSSGGEPRPLAAVVSGWEILQPVAWSHDGRFVLVVKVGTSVADSRALEIWQVPLDGTEPRNTGIRWSDSGAGITHISAHPDGRRLAISTALFSTKTWVLQNLQVPREK